MVIHKQNGGLAAARNTGYLEATGTYLISSSIRYVPVVYFEATVVSVVAGAVHCGTVVVV